LNKLGRANLTFMISLLETIRTHHKMSNGFISG